MKKQIPKSWASCTLGDVIRIQNGYAFPSSDFRTEGVPLIRQSNLHGDRVSLDKCVFLDAGYLQNRPEFILNKNDVLIGMSGSIGKLCIYDLDYPALQNQRTGKVVPLSSEHISWRFIWEYLKTIEVRLLAKSKGLGVVNVSAKDIETLPLTLPPLNEQRRIASKLEELFARVSACRKELEQLPRLLKQFRQSVLMAACSGKLTADWREQHDSESASELLAQILTERRKKWESDQVQKMLANGKTPKDERWKDKYIEPIAPGNSDPETLPSGWVWGTWNQISNWVTYGFTRPMPHVETGIPIVTAKHVVNRKIQLSDTDITTEKAYRDLSEKDRPKVGDILVTKDGTIGRAAIVETEEPFCINQSVAVIQLRSLTLERKYCLYVIESPFTQRQIMGKARGNAIQHLSITDFAATPLPIPGRAEQQEIVRRVEALFKIADAVEDRHRQAQAQLDKLPPSILAKAFRGDLVPQDPRDEPASVLLERIRNDASAQKRCGVGAKKRPKRAGG